jgi:hypothetical protein
VTVAQGRARMTIRVLPPAGLHPGMPEGMHVAEGPFRSRSVRAYRRPYVPGVSVLGRTHAPAF